MPNYRSFPIPHPLLPLCTETRFLRETGFLHFNDLTFSSLVLPDCVLYPVKHYIGTSTNPGDPVKSVPEPTSVLAFLLVGGALALKNKKKSLPVAISAKSA
ncbi:MAG TPA: hypothetical protein DDW76_17720 [Cyanobacteria bacterium UBA11369]|nr:hypothetical protein [Cyanobacteria bacterium UBA11371]HBE35166.1 hypothetical protein [Cyanobacteria bacterium UBA11368]HBE50583.1 hypothetical protein [Cyanobacteria bacterium UBA11369]